MNALAGRRGRAYLRDCTTYLGLAAATVPLGVVFMLAGWGGNRTFALAVSAVPPLAATLLAAAQESGGTQATPGKRAAGLVVTDAHGARVRFGRAVLRNAVKIGVPWQIGHVLAIGAAFGGFETGDPSTIAATVVTYPLLAAMIIAVVRGDGRGLHDRVAGTAVAQGGSAETGGAGQLGGCTARTRPHEGLDLQKPR